MRCSISIGFHGRSKLARRWENWRLRPSVPLCVRSSAPPRAWNSSVMGWRSGGGVEPLMTKVSTPARRSSAARAAWVCRNWVKITAPPSTRVSGASSPHLRCQLPSSGACSRQARAAARSGNFTSASRQAAGLLPAACRSNLPQRLAWLGLNLVRQARNSVSHCCQKARSASSGSNRTVSARRDGSWMPALARVLRIMTCPSRRRSSSGSRGWRGRFGSIKRARNSLGVGSWPGWRSVTRL